jgi:hypothetical protein
MTNRTKPAAEETEAAPSVNDVDIMKDIDVSKLDWSLLNVDASTLTALAAEGKRRVESGWRRGYRVVRQ